MSAQDERGFESSIPADFLPDVLDVGVTFGVDPTSSLESESLFAKLVAEFHQAGLPRTGFKDWLRARLGGGFRSAAGSRPVWIQNPQWPILGDRPMIFVGQVDVPARAGLFHDDSSFYVFLDLESGETRVIVQVA